MEAAGHTATGSGPDAAEALSLAADGPERPAMVRGGFAGSMTASVLLHGAALLLLAQAFAPSLRPVARVIPVSLVSLPGGGGGVVGPGEATGPSEMVLPTPTPPPTARAVVTRAPRRPAPTRAAEPAPAVEAPAESAVASSGGVAGGSSTSTGGSPGGGDGSGGDGSGGARVAYGQNPLPPYPLLARRMGMEGVVLLEVLVAPDGHAANVRVVDSSGFEPLDDSALRTVRERWRFIPARRDGAAVESRVTVPIRFRLSGVESAG